MDIRKCIRVLKMVICKECVRASVNRWHINENIRNRLSFMKLTIASTALLLSVYTGKIIVSALVSDRAFAVSPVAMPGSNVEGELTYGRKFRYSDQDPATKIVSKHTTLPFRYMTSTIGAGQLGNQMFKAAALLGVSHLHGYHPVIRLFPELHQVFNVSHLNDVDIGHSTQFSEQACCMYDAGIQRLSHDYNWTLNGYMQSWKYFDFVKSRVRSLFRFRDDILRKAVDFISHINTTGAVIVGVHVRTFERESGEERKVGRAAPGTGYIETAVKYFKALYSVSRFVVVSDDTTWCKQNINIGDMAISNFSDAGVDLAILSLCDHVIMTSGTFGWWGAWLAGGQTIYYNGFPRAGSWLATQLNKEDYYPVNWIGITHA